MRHKGAQCNKTSWISYPYIALKPFSLLQGLKCSISKKHLASASLGPGNWSFSQTHMFQLTALSSGCQADRPVTECFLLKINNFFKAQLCELYLHLWNRMDIRSLGWNSLFTCWTFQNWHKSPLCFNVFDIFWFFSPNGYGGENFFLFLHKL